MSILIKGMEMPKNCEGCDAKALCKNYWRRVREQYTRPSWCPLVPVPPHGRLIDADALYEDCALDNRYEVAATTTRINEYMQLKIDAAPTIIPADRPNAETEVQQEYLQNWHEEGE